jgi:hypothetical protein
LTTSPGGFVSHFLTTITASVGNELRASDL